MKIDGLEWMDWLHKTRCESESERKRLGQSRVEWLARIEREAEQIRAEVRVASQSAASDKLRSGD